MKFKNKNHQAIFYTAANKLNRSDNVKMSVLYLLTADVRLWNASKHHIKKGYIDLDSIKVQNGNIKAYTLLCVAKDIACGTSYVTEHFKVILSKNGLKRIRFHDLRHSCASMLLANKVPMKMIQDWLGHSDMSTTANIYSHIDYTSKIETSEVLSNVLAVNI